MSIRFKLSALFGLLFAALIGVGLLAHQTTARMQQGFVRNGEIVAAFTEREVPLMATLGRVKLDVVEVQQWLTDISATRAEDGLADGFGEAETAARAFAADAAEAARIAGQIGDARLNGAVERLGAAFPAFYATGKRMARAYVDGGPAAGNRVMADFDAAAEAMAASVDRLGEIVEMRIANSGVAVAKSSALTIAAGEAGLSRIAVAVGAALLVAGVLGAAAIRAICGPMAGLTAHIEAMAEGARDAGYADDRCDEIGAIARAVERVRLNALARQKALQDKEIAELQSRAARQQRIAAATQRFDATVGGLVAAIGAAVERLHASADTLSANASRTRQRSASVAAATRQASVNVDTVAAAANQLIAAVREISRQVQISSAIAQSASGEAADTNRRIAGFADSAERIGDVLGLIATIAGQTNLLALNATIASAAADDPDTGFAGAAGEVKGLAGQTARATEQISRQILEIQGETRSSVEAIAKISDTIVQLNRVAAVIAGAVEEQSAATAEIARNVALASAGTRTVGETIGGVAAAAAETGRMAEQVFSAAAALRDENASLEREITRFLEEVRTA